MVQKGWGTDVCGQAELPLSYNPDPICAECHGTYVADQEWLECNLCDQRFREECFSFKACVRYFLSNFHFFAK